MYVLAEMLSIRETPLSPPRSQIGGCGTGELVGAVGAIELAVAHEVRLDALGHVLQTSGNNRQGAFRASRYLKYDRKTLKLLVKIKNSF